MTEISSGRLKELEERADAEAEAEGNPFDDLIEMILDLDPGVVPDEELRVTLQRGEDREEAECGCLEYGRRDCSCRCAVEWQENI